MAVIKRKTATTKRSPVKSRQVMRFEVLLEPAEEGGYAVHVPALRGCHTQGETVEECLENAKDAIESYLAVVHELATRHRRVKRYEVEIAV